MSLISKLVKAGVAAGAAYAAVKISEKYKRENPNGVSDPAEKVNAIKQATSEFASEVTQAAEEKAPELIKTVTGTAHVVADVAKQYAPDAVAKVQEVARTVADKAQVILNPEAVDAEFTSAEEETPVEEVPAEDPPVSGDNEPLEPIDVEKK